MQQKSTDGITQARGKRRRLSTRVLAPLVACGLLLVGGTTTAATLSARDAADRALDARAEALQSSAANSLRRSGRIGPAAALARSDGGALRVSAADRPLPGGRSVTTRGERRVYVYTVARRGDDVRLSVALPAEPVAEATRRALVLAGGTGLALLLLTLLAVQGALRRAAVRPLRDMARAVERLSDGEPARISRRGAREVVAVGASLDTVAARMAELEAQATTDPLTGVGNRRSFQSALGRELKRATRDGRDLALVLIDLDGFKGINDTQGHPFGDGVLQMVAEKLSGSLRATDVVARVGGDEFAVLLPGTTRERAEAFVHRARDEATGAIGGVELTWCAGVASFPADATDADTLVECADVALYCAKATGQSSVCHYDPSQSESASGGDHAAVEQLLRLPDGVVPVYQPLVSLQTGEVAGYEALARFPHPPARRPDEWFAIATRCGLGPQLERHAVEAALAAGNRPAGTYLSFNLSASALMYEGVIESLPEDLTDIVIEITENERVTDAEALATRLAPLRARGARIAVDDAGAGYSGLQQVMKIQPDLIKLDRSLVANVDSDPAKAALIDSFVRFAARTGASVCAEGIETPEELRVLADLDVTYGQGFGIARPAPPWASVAPWVAGMVRPLVARSAEPETDESADHRLAALTARLANIRGEDELRGLATLMAAELAADDLALLRRGADAGTLEAVSDHPWLPAGAPIALSYYPTLRDVLASQDVYQVKANDPAADLGELALLGRTGRESMLIAPIVAHGDVVGLLLAFAAEERAWTRAETSRARIVGHQLGSVVDALSSPSRAVALP